MCRCNAISWSPGKELAGVLIRVSFRGGGDSFLLQSDLDQLSAWCQDNGMSFNISKYCLLRFHNRTANAISTGYTVNNVNLSSLDHCRDLGIIISTDMERQGMMMATNYYIITANSNPTALTSGDYSCSGAVYW